MVYSASLIQTPCERYYAFVDGISVRSMRSSSKWDVRYPDRLRRGRFVSDGRNDNPNRQLLVAVDWGDPARLVDRDSS